MATLRATVRRTPRNPIPVNYTELDGSGDSDDAGQFNSSNAALSAPSANSGLRFHPYIGSAGGGSLTTPPPLQNDFFNGVRLFRLSGASIASTTDYVALTDDKFQEILDLLQANDLCKKGVLSTKAGMECLLTSLIANNKDSLEKICGYYQSKTSDDPITKMNHQNIWKQRKNISEHPQNLIPQIATITGLNL